MDFVKEAFQKVREDIDLLKNELEILRESMLDLCGIIQNLEGETKKVPEIHQANRQTDRQTLKIEVPAHFNQNTTFQQIIPTENSSFKPLNDQNMLISTGNEGVPADRQTNQQTNQQTDFLTKKDPFMGKEGEKSLFEATNILNSLDNIKKEIRLKFKRLTEQELLIFSTIYQFDEEKGFSDYKSLSLKLNLSESSIRDYVARLIKKGIPLEKTKINNKTVNISISPGLKKMASLSSIIQLRDL